MVLFRPKFKVTTWVWVFNVPLTFSFQNGYVDLQLGYNQITKESSYSGSNSIASIYVSANSLAFYLCSIEKFLDSFYFISEKVGMKLNISFSYNLIKIEN